MSLCQNGAPPMFLDWTNLIVTNDQHAINRGIQVAIGTPPQLFSLLPSVNEYNIYVANKANCAPTYNDSCVGSYGGVYNSQASSTFHRTTETQWNATYEPNPGDLAFIYFNDDLSFGNATEYGYPLFMDQPGYGSQGVLPLGWNSTFLRTAVSTGAVPSEAFGLWTGSRSINNSVDGSVVLGGYDSTRFDPNELAQFTAHPDCTTCVVVTGLTYNTEQGSTSLFSNTSESLQVSLDPYYRVLQVPQDIYMNFANASNGTYDPYLANLRYSADSPPTGNITVTLNTGYETIIPAEELFVNPRLFNSQGQYTISNSTVLIPEILNVTIGSYLLNWGIPYLTMNYLIADYARNKFQMAPAIRTDFSKQGGGYELEAICDPAVPVVTPSASTSTHPPTGTGPATTISSPPVANKSSNTGAIVGGVVGGVLGLILIVGGLALVFYRSRRKARQERQEQQQGLPRDEVSQIGSATDRYSHYTGTTPGGGNELSSDGGKTPSVNHWLMAQDGGLSPPAVSPNVDRPFEMPAQSYDS